MQTFDDLLELLLVGKPAITKGARASFLRLLRLTTPSTTETTRIMDYVVKTADAEITEACLRKDMFDKRTFLHKILDNPDKQDRSRLFDLAAEASFTTATPIDAGLTKDRVTSSPISQSAVPIEAIRGSKPSTLCQHPGKAPSSAVKDALRLDNFGMIAENVAGCPWPVFSSQCEEGEILDLGSANLQTRNVNPSALAFTSRSHSTLPDRYAPSTPSDALETPRSPWSLSSVKSDTRSTPSSRHCTPPSAASNRQQRSANNDPPVGTLPQYQRLNSWQNRRKDRLADGGAMDAIPSLRLEPVVEEKRENEEDVCLESTQEPSCTLRSRDCGITESATIRLEDDGSTFADTSRSEVRTRECVDQAGNMMEWNKNLALNLAEVRDLSRRAGGVINAKKTSVEAELKNGSAEEATRFVVQDFTRTSGQNIADSKCVSMQDMSEVVCDSANVALDTSIRFTLKGPDSQAADHMTRGMPHSTEGLAQSPARGVPVVQRILTPTLRHGASSSTRTNPVHSISEDSPNTLASPSIILEVHQPTPDLPAPSMLHLNRLTPQTPSGSLFSTPQDSTLSSPASHPPQTHDGMSSDTPPWPDQNPFASPSADYTQVTPSTPGTSRGEIRCTTPPFPDDDKALVSSIEVEPRQNPSHSPSKAQVSPRTPLSRHNSDTREPVAIIDGTLDYAHSEPAFRSLSARGALWPISEIVTEKSDTPSRRCLRTPSSSQNSTGKAVPRVPQEESAPTIQIPHLSHHNELAERHVSLELHSCALTFDDLDHALVPHSAQGDTLPRVARLSDPRRTLSFSEEDNSVASFLSSGYEGICAHPTAVSSPSSPNGPLPCESRFLPHHHHSVSPVQGNAREVNSSHALWISGAPLRVGTLMEALTKLPPQQAWQELFDRIGEASLDGDQLEILSAVGNRLCDTLTSRGGTLVLDVSRIPLQVWVKLSFTPSLIPHVSPQSVGIEALNITSLSSLAAPQSKAAKGLMRLHACCRDLTSRSITIPERTRHLDSMRAMVDSEGAAFAEYVNHLVHQYGQVPSYGDAKAFADHNMLPFVFPDFFLDEMKRQLSRNELTCVKAALQVINTLLTHVPAATMLVERRCRETVVSLLKNRGVLKTSAESVLTKMGWCPVQITPNSNRSSETSDEVPALIPLNTFHAADGTKCDGEDVKNLSDSSLGLTHQVTQNAPRVANCPRPLKRRGLAVVSSEPARQITPDPPKSPHDLQSSKRGSARNSTSVDPERLMTHESAAPTDDQSIIFEAREPRSGSTPVSSSIPRRTRASETPTLDMPKPETPPPNTRRGSVRCRISSSSSPPTYGEVSSTTPPLPDDNPFASPGSNLVHTVSGTPGTSCGEISSDTPPLPHNDASFVSPIVVETLESSASSLPNAQLSPNPLLSGENGDTDTHHAAVDTVQKSVRPHGPTSSRSVPNVQHSASARSAVSASRHVKEPLSERSETPPWRRWRAPSSHPSSSILHAAHKEEQDSGVYKSPSSDYDRLFAFAKSQCRSAMSSPSLHDPVLHPAASSTACSPIAPLRCESRFLSRRQRGASPAKGDANEASNLHASWISDTPLNIETLAEALMELPPERAWQELLDRISEAWRDNDELSFLSAVGNRLCDALTCRSGILVLNGSRIPVHAWAKLSFARRLAPHVSPQSVGIEPLVGWNATNARDASQKHAGDHPPPAPLRSKAAKGLIRLHEACKGLISRSMTVPERTQHLDVMRTIVVTESGALAEYVNHLVHQYGQVPSYGDAKAFADHDMLPFVFPDFLLDELKKQLGRSELTCVKATIELINALLTHVPAATMLVVRRCGEAVARLLKNRGALKTMAEDVLTRMGWRAVWNECRRQALRGKNNKSVQQQSGLSVSSNSNGYLDDLMLYLPTVLDDSATVDSHVVDVCKFLHNEATQSPQNRTALQACRLIPQNVLNQLPRKLRAALQQCIHHKPIRCERLGLHSCSHISAVSRSVSPTQSPGRVISTQQPPQHPHFTLPSEAGAPQYSAWQSPPLANHKHRHSSPLPSPDQGKLTVRGNNADPSFVSSHQAPHIAEVDTQVRPSKVVGTNTTSADTSVPCGLRALRPPWVQTLLSCAEEDLTVAYAEVTSGLKKTDFIRVPVRALSEVLQRLTCKMAVDARTPSQGDATTDDVLLLLSQFLGLSPPARLCIALLSISPTGVDPLADKVIDRLLTHALQMLESAENTETGSLDITTLLSYAGRSTLAGAWRPKLAAIISHLNPRLCVQFLNDTGHAQSFGGQLTKALSVNEACGLWEE